MASESETRRVVAPIWIILFIGVGAAILASSVRIDEHNSLKPIVESLGDGLLLLGLIDLFFQSRVISWLTRPSEISNLNEQWKKVSRDLDEAQRKLDDFNQKTRLENIENQSTKTLETVEELLKELKVLKSQIGRQQRD
jgi:peptidoglycan hydrolase CwlO-like protein